MTEIKILVSHFLDSSPTPAAKLFKNLLYINKLEENKKIDYIKTPINPNININKKRFLLAPFAIRNLARKYNIVHSPHMHRYFKKLLEMRNKNIKHIHTVHGIIPSHNYDILDKEKSKMDANIKRSIYPIETADKVVCVSEYMKSLVKNHLDIKSEVIYNGVNTDIFHPSKNTNSVETKYDINNKFVLYIGRPVQKKRFDIVLQMATIFTNTEFVIRPIGSISTSELPNNVTILPYLSKDELAKLYSAADVLLFPSENEPFGMVSVEAMAAGTPVIAHDSGASKELIMDGVSGYLTNNTIDRVEDKLRVLLHNEDLRTNMGRRARDRVEAKFSLEQMINKYSELYYRVYNN